MESLSLKATAADAIVHLIKLLPTREALVTLAHKKGLPYLLLKTYVQVAHKCTEQLQHLDNVSQLATLSSLRNPNEYIGSDPKYSKYIAEVRHPNVYPFRGEFSLICLPAGRNVGSVNSEHLSTERYARITSDIVAYYGKVGASWPHQSWLCS